MRTLALVGLTVATTVNSIAQTGSDMVRFKLVTLDPGHFHAALVQKFMYADVDPVVHVYAPGGGDLSEHLNRVQRFNTRSNQPTHWQEQVYTGPDFLEKMLADKSGNVVVIAGNNARKTDYILRSVQAGLNVLADKPMAITPADFERLQRAFDAAAAHHVLLYDIMTERYEVTTQLLRELSRNQALFGDLEPGSPEHPAIWMESVHHFLKSVAGVPLKRPEWFFDTRQEGQGITDVSTHLVDLVQWEAFPGTVLSPADVTLLSARRWATPVTLDQFKWMTGAEQFPNFLNSDLTAGVLQVSANGEFTYRLRGIVAKISVSWKVEAPPGAGDTLFSSLRGTKATLVIRQGAEQQFKPALYVEPSSTENASLFEEQLNHAIAQLQHRFPGVGLLREGNVWRIRVPESFDVGHEAHFAQVTETYLGYLREGRLPEWETAGMLTKYATIMQAYQLSQ